MKKWIALLLAAVLCLSLVACGNKVEDIEVNGETVSVTDTRESILRIEFSETVNGMFKAYVLSDIFK